MGAHPIRTTKRGEKNADPGSTPNPRLQCTMKRELLDGVHELLNAALTLSGLVLVDDTLGGSLVEQAARLVGGVLSGSGVTGLDGGANLLERTARLR